MSTFWNCAAAPQVDQQSSDQLFLADLVTPGDYPIAGHAIHFSILA
jgi:hypothetical protein